MDLVFDEARSQLQSWSKRKDKLLTPNEDCREAARITAKVLYDAGKTSEGEHGKKRMDAMQELVVDDFDHQQIWAGLEMQNSARLSEWRRGIEALLNLPGQRIDLLGGDPVYRNNNRKRKRTEEGEGEEEEEEELEDDLEEMELEKRVKFEEEEEDEEEELDDEEDEEEGEKGSSEEGDSILNDPDFQNMSDSDGDDLPLFDNVHSEDEDDDEKDSDEEKKEKPKTELQLKTEEYLANAMNLVRGKGSEVDDDFFKLSEMEKFLEDGDMAEERRRRREEKGMEDDEDDPDRVDYFADDDDDGDEYDEKEERAMHTDYFGEQEEAKEEAMEEDEEEEEEEEEEEDSTPMLKNLLANDDSDDEAKDLGEVKSTYEERQLRLKKKIKALETEAVSEEKPWQLRGEITSASRPENSLLQEHLDYDTVAKAAPIITEEVSKRLEDIILQRVQDQAFDDVERKVKTAEDPYEYKKRLVLDQEKSKLSLAQVYEQDFLSQQEKDDGEGKASSLLDREDDNNGEQAKEAQVIRKAMNSLFAKLDTLTHFHFTPKNLNAEVKIVKNMPSVAVEDVAPVTASDATLLAPQEIADTKRGAPLGSTERTETDMKRDRRRKKSKQHKIHQLEEKRLADNTGPESKQKAMKRLQDQEKKGKLSTVKEDHMKSKSVKSSSAFFSQLQQETTASVKEKAKALKKKQRDAGGKELKARSMML